jgi:AraC-like DNA-binding protein
MTAPSISSGAVRRLISTLRELGVDLAPILAEAGVDERVGDDPDGRVPIRMLHTLWDAALRRHPRSDGALLGAQRYNPGDYGLVGFVCMNSATLGEALRHLVRYLHLWTDDPAMRLDDDGTLELSYRNAFPDSLGLRCATEAALAEILHGARIVTHSPLAPREVSFTHDAPPETAAHEAFFQAPVRFNQPVAAMRFFPEQLTTPLPTADAQLGAFLRDLANQALARQVGPEEPSAIDQVQRLIAEELRNGVPTQAQIARVMAVSERTLRRRLEEHGTTFRDILDETRAQMAHTYVRDPRLPLSEVAFLLGFSEPSAFHRAFRRWTGLTPAAYRARETSASRERPSTT